MYYAHTFLSTYFSTEKDRNNPVFFIYKRTNPVSRVLSYHIMIRITICLGLSLPIASSGAPFQLYVSEIKRARPCTKVRILPFHLRGYPAKLISNQRAEDAPMFPSRRASLLAPLASRRTGITRYHAP